MVEETEYDDHIECHHSYSERCHTTYTTDFEPQQEEECNENFRKSCFIEYKKIAIEEPVRQCHTPLICEGVGPEECKTVYESGKKDDIRHIFGVTLARVVQCDPLVRSVDLGQNPLYVLDPNPLPMSILLEQNPVSYNPAALSLIISQ